MRPVIPVKSGLIKQSFIPASSAVVAALLLASCLQEAIAGTGESPDHFAACEGPRQVTDLIDTEGGTLKLGRFKLEVYAGTLEEETEITLRRIPGDSENPDRCSLRDTYTTEPFMLASVPGKPFVGRWTVTADDVASGKEDKVVCPKVSWTEDVSRLECYQEAAVPSTQDICYARRRSITGNRIFTCTTLGSNWSSSTRRRFLTDHLGHFRLLDPMEGGMSELLQYSKQYSNPRGSKPPPGCVEIPDVGLRPSVLFEHHGSSTEVAWTPYCHDNHDCDEDSYCRRPIGRCTALGVCTSIRSSGDSSVVRDAPWRQEPVCGCDGVTYADDWERQANRVSLRSKGRCAEPSNTSAGAGKAGDSEVETNDESP